MPRASIAVVIATYNGARYLPAQLSSLWAQTTQDFVVIARDDGSTDDTPAILHAACAQRPTRLHVITDADARLGPMRSFARLIAAADADYIAFCDQDDHWLPEKLATQRQAIADVEARMGRETPVLVCSDVIVADSELRPTHPSYFRRHGLRPVGGKDLRLARLLFRNVAIGTATMINAALARRCLPIPEMAVMHDWWCALVATVTGQVVVLPQPMLLYRQHAGNAVGSRVRSAPRTVGQAREALHWAQQRVAGSVRQAQALSAVMDSHLSPSDRMLLQRVAAFDELGPIARGLAVLRSRAFKSGVALNTLHMVACMTAPIPR